MTELRGMALRRWENDPKLLGITLARYKFVARMFGGMGNVLEVGCDVGFGARVVKQHVDNLTAIDKDPVAIEKAIAGNSDAWPIRFLTHDILAEPLPGFDGVYCLDVFEHIADEERLLDNLSKSARIVIIGIPSLESQRYASQDSLLAHVNCKSGADFKRTLRKHWQDVFLFGMNDETLHTGFHPMSHYLLAVCV